jgi:DNA-binding CsgD family transcriptional regulator
MVQGELRMVGFVWRRIPGISQHKLGLETLYRDSFDKWSSYFLARYEQECKNDEQRFKEQTDLLLREGAERLYVAPEAVGSIKLKILERLLREIPVGTFVLVPSWGDLCSPSMVDQFVADASLQERYFILPIHKSLRLMPSSEIQQVHKSWVVDSIPNTYVSTSSKRDQILALQEQGLSPEQIQLELGMSKSTYYRQLDAATPIIDRKKQILDLLAKSMTPVEIQASLGISSSSYYRIMGQMTFSDSHGNQFVHKPEN